MTNTSSQKRSSSVRLEISDQTTRADRFEGVTPK